MMKLTHEQRRALKRVYDRSPLNTNHTTLHRGETPISYRAFRRSVQPLLGDTCVMVRWQGMWLGIETDGHTHS